MNRLLVALLPCLCLTLPAADADFNGDWNITVPNPRNRVWWLRVQGAGTAQLSGSFVGAPGGQVDPIEEIRLQGGELQFAFRRTRDDKPLVLTYKARLKGKSLAGSVEESVDGAPGTVVRWSAMRAPVLNETDSEGWKAGQPVELLNGQDLSAWRLLVPARPGWIIEERLLKNRAGASDVVSTAKFWNFELGAEYRYAAGSNSGIALRGRYEVQIFDDFGQPASFHGNGALYCRETPSANASKPPGEWQSLIVRLVGRQLTVTLNGRKVLDRVRALPTAMAMDAAEDQPGPIVLQGDHGPIEFRKLTILPLTRTP